MLQGPLKRAGQSTKIEVLCLQVSPCNQDLEPVHKYHSISHCRKAQAELIRNTLRDATMARGRGAQISPANGISPSDMLATAKLGRKRGVVAKVMKETFALVAVPVKSRAQSQREVRHCKISTSGYQIPSLPRSRNIILTHCICLSRAAADALRMAHGRNS